MLSRFRWFAFIRWIFALSLMAVASGAFAFGQLSKFVLLTNQDPSFSTTGTWSSVSPPPVSGFSNPTFYGEFYLRTAASGAGTTATANWDFGVLAPSPGTYSFDAFIPDSADFSGSAVVYRLFSAPNNIFSGCGAYSLMTTFTGVNADGNEGRWLPIGTETLATGTCYRLQVTNQGNATAFILANAVRAERLFESSATITDMPRVAGAVTAGLTNITSTSNAAPTIITTLTVTCPQAGQVLVVGGGESAAVTNIAGTNFNGLAYSVSMNSTATDNSNVVQSSALATFNGDANRDFLHVGRTDSCSAGQSITYRLTGYRSQAATGPSSFIWNGRLVAQYFSASF